MFRIALLLVVTLIGCAKAPAAAQGPAIVSGSGIAITQREIVTRLADQPPGVRRQFQTTEGKKQFIEEAIRFELLAKSAREAGLADDPDVQFIMKKVMLTKYHDRFVKAHPGVAGITEAEVKAYYDAHLDEFTRPARVRTGLIFFAAEATQAPERAAKSAKAKQVAAALSGDLDEPAFAQEAKTNSDDPSARVGGDLGFLTQDELAVYDPAVANAVMALPVGQTSGVIETPRGLYVVHAFARQDAQNRPLESARASIAAQLGRAKEDADYKALVEKLRSEATVTIDAQALEQLNLPLVPPNPE